MTAPANEAPACARAAAHLILGGMRYPTPLVPGTLIQRYKRFLADDRDLPEHRLDDGADGPWFGRLAIDQR